MSRTARRLGLAALGIGFAGLAAFATAGPAAADNGPHISTLQSIATADGCAKCHRIHSAQQEYAQFNFSVSVNQWCESCHSGDGAQTNVQYGKLMTDSVTVSRVGLRGGGFSTAYLDGTGATYTSATGGIVGVLSASAPAEAIATTSNHTLETEETMWGSGPVSGTANGGAKVELECVSCHDPHGNGNFRILRPIGSMVDVNQVSLTANLPAQFIKIKAVAIDAKLSAALLQGYSTRNKINGAAKATNGYYYWQDWTFTAVDSASVATLTPGQTLLLTDSASATVLPTQPGGVGVPAAGSKGGYGTVIAVNYNAGTFTLTKMNGYYSAVAMDSSTVPFPAVPSDSLTATTFLAVPNLPSTIVKAVSNATQDTITYTTAQAHGMLVGQRVTVSAVATGWSAAKMTVTSIPSSTSFTVNFVRAAKDKPTASTTLYAGMGAYVSGIPDDVNATDGGTEGTPVGETGYKRVYTTANYWKVDDHFESGTAGSAASPFIKGIAQWCSSCHTRYYSVDSSGRYYANGGDGMFEYRHTSGEYAGSDGSAKNCIQCHVAHGTNVQMNGTYSSQVTRPDGTSAGTQPSALLRVDNRGVCAMCHSSYASVPLG